LQIQQKRETTKGGRGEYANLDYKRKHENDHLDKEKPDKRGEKERPRGCTKKGQTIPQAELKKPKISKQKTQKEVENPPPFLAKNGDRRGKDKFPKKVSSQY